MMKCPNACARRAMQLEYDTDLQEHVATANPPCIPSHRNYRKGVDEYIPMQQQFKQNTAHTVQ